MPEISGQGGNGGEIGNFRPALPDIPVNSELEKEPLLTAEDERLLATQIQAGLEAATQLERDDLEQAQRRDLRRIVREGDAAKERMIKANFGFVRSLANRYVSSGMDIEDLEQEGRVGLIKAAAKYQPDRGARFATFGFYYVRGHILRAISEQSWALRLPQNVSDEVRQFRATQNQLSQSLGREPTDEEVAEDTGTRVTSRRNLEGVIRTVPLESGRGFGSNREFTGDEGTPQLKSDPIDILATDDNKQMEAEVFNELAHEDLRKLMAEVLDEKEREVVTLRLGFYDDELKSYAQVAEHFALTASRVNQIYNDAIDKLRFRQDFVMSEPNSQWYVTARRKETLYQAQAEALQEAGIDDPDTLAIMNDLMDGYFPRLIAGRHKMKPGQVRSRINAALAKSERLREVFERMELRDWYDE